MSKPVKLTTSGVWYIMAMLRFYLSMKEVTAIKRIIALLLLAGLSISMALPAGAAGPTAGNYDYVLPAEYTIDEIFDVSRFIEAHAGDDGSRALYDYSGNRVSDWYASITYNSDCGCFIAGDSKALFTLGADGSKTGFSTTHKIAGSGDGIVVTTDLELTDGMPLKYYTGDYHVYTLKGTLLSTIARSGLTGTNIRPTIDFSDGLYCFESPAGLYGAVDVSGTIVLQPEYELLKPFVNGVAVAEINGKYGLVDKSGKAVLEFVYDSISEIKDSTDPHSGAVVYVTTQGDSYGLATAPGFAVSAMPDLNVFWIGSYPAARVLVLQTRDNKFGLLSYDGKVILPIEYDAISAPSEGVVAVRKGEDGCGYFTLDGKQLTDQKYRVARPFSLGLAYVLLASLDGNGQTVFKSAFIDHTGAAAIELGSSDCWTGFSEGFAAVIDRDGNHSYIDLTGKTVMTAENGTVWRQSSDFHHGLATVAVPSADGSGEKNRAIRYTGGTPSDWAAGEVTRAVSLDLVPQYLQKYYGAAITRGDFCTLAFELLKKSGTVLMTPSDSAPMTFTDTDSRTIYTLSRLGIVTGYSPTEFAPDDAITREQAAAILSRLAGYLKITAPGPSGYSYSDDNEISGWALPAAYTMFELGVMKGTGNNNFSPKTTYSVQQAIVTMLRLYSA